MQTYPEAELTQFSGAAYSLPELRYDVSFVDTIGGCPTLVGIAGQPTYIGSVAFNRKATATASYAAGERIAIDHAALTSIMKTSKYGFKSYNFGIVKSINSGAEDQTGPFLKSVVSVALSAYGLVNPVSAALLAELPSFRNCLNANKLGLFSEMAGGTGYVATTPPIAR